MARHKSTIFTDDIIEIYNNILERITTEKLNANENSPKNNEKT